MSSKERVIEAIRGLRLPIPYQEFYPPTHLGIVELLTAYSRPIRIGFITQKVRSTEAEVQQKLTLLQQAGVIVIEAGMVTLIKETQN